jgi:hypothetical protein
MQRNAGCPLRAHQEPATDFTPNFNQGFLGMARDHPLHFRALIATIVWPFKYPPWLAVSAQFAHGMPPAEASVMARPEIRNASIASLVKVLRQGAGGIQWDTAPACCPWDFQTEDIAAPVRL